MFGRTQSHFSATLNGVIGTLPASSLNVIGDRPRRSVAAECRVRRFADFAPDGATFVASAIPELMSVALLSSTLKPRT